ncbi:MAG: Ribosomal RNA small subunit methyltransferase B [Verrucomicrobiae bacterium]|nr:Ribosomal RNA small subunit methyltransferase B [Verrucomicrobiae bacterium]
MVVKHGYATLSPMTARQIAFDLLTTWPRSRSFADELLAHHPALHADDRPIVQELFYGCLRQRLALDYLIETVADKKPRAGVLTLLHLGLYELHFMKSAPHAAVHETVELAKHHVSPAEVRFINAILRNADPTVLERAEPWIRLSHPRWLYDRHGTAWCEWNNTPPPVYARGDQAWPGVLEPTAFHPLCYRVVDAPAFFAAPGKYYVQDPSTLLAVDLLDPQPGEAILDLCAAPGGKATYIAQKMQNLGQIIAADSSNVRLAKVTENCRRLGVTIVATLACANGRCLRGRQFDRVLVDAPCSNTGVIRRRVDLRWRIREEELRRLADVQKKLLAVARELVKPGGVVVYSTCSLEPEENEQVVAQAPGFVIEEQRASRPPSDNMDGAFVCKMRAA